VAMLACARLGAPHTVVFGGFSGKAVAERCNDLECKVLITQDESMRGGKSGAQKTNADEGLAAGPTTVEKVVVVKRSGADIPMGDRDVYLDDLVADVSGDASDCPCEPMESEDLLFLLYTSGSTGKPKGVVHTTGGYLVGTATTHNLVFDVKDGRKTALRNSGFGTVFAVADDRPLPVCDYAGFAPFGFGYRRCPGEQLTIMAFEDLIRKVAKERLEFVKVAGANPEKVPLGPGTQAGMVPIGPTTVINDDIGFIRPA